MKRNIIIASLAVICTASIGYFLLKGQNSHEFILRGNFPQLPDSIKVELINAENEDIKLICDTFPQNGRFVLQGHVDGPTMCSLRFCVPNKNFPSGFWPVSSQSVMVENCKMTFRCDLSLDSLSNCRKRELEAEVTGGKAQKQLMEALRATIDFKIKADNAGYQESMKFFETCDDPDTTRKYLTLTRTANDEYLQARMAFIREHPSYYISAFWTEKELNTQYVYDADQLRSMAQTVSTCPDTARMARIGRKLNLALRYAVLQPYKDFEITASDRSIVKFSTLVPAGKYMLVDFWASWCGPCRSAIPQVEELYRQYENKLNICSISLDKKEEEWREAMQEEKMPWPQFRAEKEQLDSICQAYLITSIPRLILLNGKGEIVCSTYRPGDITNYLKEHVEP